MSGRVAHVLRKYDPTEWGGTETYVAAVTARLGPLGWLSEVHAPAGPRGRNGALAPDVPLRRFHAFLPYVASAERRAGLVANAGNIVSLEEPLRLVRDRTLRLVHLHTMGRLGGAVRWAMARTARPYVVSVHGPLLAQLEWLAADTARRTARTLDLGKPFGLLFGARHVLDDAARVITFNEEERRAIAERVGDRVIRMDHGVDLARFAAGDANRARARWPELGDDPVVLLVGRLSGQKNQLLAVRAFARGAPSDHRLVLAGADTDAGYLAEVEREARSLGVRDRLHLLGNVQPSDVPDLYARATLCVVPSTHEAFGLVVLEAMAARRPVLFADHSGLADIAAALGDETAVVPSLDPRAWAASLARLLATPDARAAAASRGLELVRSRYSWDAVTARLAGVYEAVAHTPRPQA